MTGTCIARAALDNLPSAVVAALRTSSSESLSMAMTAAACCERSANTWRARRRQADETDLRRRKVCTLHNVRQATSEPSSALPESMVKETL